MHDRTAPGPELLREVSARPESGRAGQRPGSASSGPALTSLRGTRSAVRASGVGRSTAQGPPPVVVCREPRLLDMIAAAAASVGVEPLVLRQGSEIRQAWGSAPAVLVGAESAPLVAGLALPERSGVYVVCTDAAGAAAWSVPLSAAVIELPAHAGFLPTVLGQSPADHASSTIVLDIAAGSGGVGASTLAAALAQRCAAQSRTVALVDCDPDGGGIDLMFAAEREPGWRWHDLSSASGTLGDLAGRLPRVASVDVLSMGRGPASGVTDPAGLPAMTAFRSVFDALARGHDVVVLDNPDAREWRGTGSARRLLVVAAEVRAVMAARARLERCAWQDAWVVVRTGPGMSVDPAAVAENLGLPLAGVVRTDRRLVEAVATGVPLSRRNPGRRFRPLDSMLDSTLRGVVPDA